MSEETAVEMPPAKSGGAEEAKENGDAAVEAKKEFVPSTGLTTAEANELMAIWGPNELADKRVSKWVLLLKQFIQPMPIMIWIAIAIMAGIQNWPDMGVLLGIQFINAFLGWYEMCKAGDAVAALKASLKPQAVAKRDGTWQTIEASLLVPGDMVLLAAGAAIPADCQVNEGQIQVDQSALTGESLPVTMYRGDSCKMGSTVTRGEVEGTVEFTGKHTFFGKTATMLQSVDQLGNLQKVLMRVMIILLTMSIVLCGTAMIYLLVEGESFEESLEFTVVLLVASIPIAIEIVTTTTLAIGSRKLSQQGAIVTRLVAIEEMAGMNMLCSDKTGTLTLNKMVIQDDTPIYTAGEDRRSVLLAAAMAAKWKEPPKDALDTMVLGAVDRAGLEGYEMLDHMPFDPTVKRTESTIKGPDGVLFKVTKGAPHIVLALVANKAEIEHEVEAKITELGTRGIRALAIAKAASTDEHPDNWQLLGILTFLDPPRPDTKYTIEKSLEYGVDVKMITGDHLLIAKETSRVLGMGVNILNADNLPTMEADGKVDKDLGKKYGQQILDADGFAQVYPEHKFLIVEALRQMGFGVGMTGDGVNDAPALKKADVGIAVSGATDAARAAADIVLTKEGLSVLVDAIVIARCIFQRVYNFFNYRIAATLQLLTFFFIAVLSMHPPSFTLPEDDAAAAEWEDQHFFKLPVLMLMLITLLNDGTLLSIAYDHVIPSQRPEKWNLKVLFFISAILGGVAMGSSLLLLWACLDSNSPDSLFNKMNIEPMHYGQIITAIYLKVSVSDFLTLFSARTKSFFFLLRPSPLLLLGAMIALTVSTLLACFWPEGDLEGTPVEGLVLGDYKLYVIWIWIYCIVFWFIQDLLKVIAYKIIFRFNIFGATSSALVNVRRAHTFDDATAAATAGMTETKLMERAVDDAQEQVDRLAKKTGDPALQRASVDVGLMRQSVQLARTSIARVSLAQRSGGAGPDLERASVQMGDVVQRIEEAAAGAESLSPEQQAQLDAQLARISRASQTLARISSHMPHNRQ